MSKYDHQIEPQLSRIYEDPELRYLAISRDVSVVVLVGLPFTGKTSLARFLAEDYGVGAVSNRDSGVVSAISKAARSLRRRPAVVTVDGVSEVEFGLIGKVFRPRPIVVHVTALDADLWNRARQAKANTNQEQFEAKVATERLTVDSIVGAAKRARSQYLEVSGPDLSEAQEKLVAFLMSVLEGGRDRTKP